MGLLSGLLTGGLLVGKICQTVAEIAAFDEESGIEISDKVQIGDVIYYRSNKNGAPNIWALNKNTQTHASICVPNDHDEGGVNYYVNPASSMMIPELTLPGTAPSTIVTSGMTNMPTGFASMAGGGNSIMRLAFKGLTIGKTVSVGSFRVKCNTTQLIVLSSALSINALTYMWLNSDKGASVSLQERLEPSNRSADAAGETDFELDFSEFSINPQTDLIEGNLSLEIQASAEQLEALSAGKSEPLHPFEEAHFRSIGLIDW